MRTGDEAISINDEGIPHVFDTSTAFIDSPTPQEKNKRYSEVRRDFGSLLIVD
ncbi:MAG TPA: hypothetical protein VIJ87_19175 [Pyrinomonadaceae bacterium]